MKSVFFPASDNAFKGKKRRGKYKKVFSLNVLGKLEKLFEKKGRKTTRTSSTFFEIYFLMAKKKEEEKLFREK